MNLVGVHSHLFRGPPSAVAASLRDYRLACVQLTPNFPHLRFEEPGHVTTDRCRQAAEPFLEAGIVVVGLAGGHNLLDPEVDRRHPAIVRLHALIRHTRDFGTERVILSVDHCEEPDPPCPIASPMPSRWMEIRCIITEAVRVAEDYGVELLLKLESHRNGRWEATMGRMLGEIAPAKLRFVIDPANYLVGSAADTLREDAETLCEALGPRAPLVHAKDLCFGSAGVTTPRAGQGCFDYATFLKLYRRYQPDVPIILEHVRPSEIEETRAYMESCLRAAE
jgi:L-ribulose-5-phosphate 3-epimerase